MSLDPSKPQASAEEGVSQERAAALFESERPPAVFYRPLLAEVFAHARECYPEECCGIILGPRDGEPRQVVRCTNVQSVRHSKGESQLDAGHGFWIDEQELERALRDAEQRGETLRVVYHSHIDTGAHLSQTDVESALGPEGAPLWPGVGHLVISVGDNGVQAVALFEWDSECGIYIGRQAREAD
jgi:proteasome lid subunit RPN8/RPN11